MDDKLIKALCGDRAVKDAPGALGMKNPELIEFIKGKAPPEVMSIFERLQKKTRPELGKLLSLFQDGRDLLKASQPNILENMKKNALIIANMIPENQLRELNAGLGNLVFGDATINWAPPSRKQEVDPFRGNAKLNAYMQAQLMKSGVKRGKNKRATRMEVFAFKPKNVKRRPKPTRYKLPKPPPMLNIKGTRRIKLGDNVVLPTKPLPKKTRRNVSSRAESIMAGMNLPENMSFDEMLNKVRANLFRKAKEQRNLGMGNSSDNNNAVRRPAFSMIRTNAKLSKKVPRGSVRARILNKFKQMDLDKKRRDPKQNMSKKNDDYDGGNFNNIDVFSNSNKNDTAAEAGENFPNLSNSNSSNNNKRKARAVEKFKKFNKPIKLIPAPKRTKKTRRLVLKPVVRAGMEKLYNSLPGGSNRPSVKNLTNQELKNAVNRIVNNM